MAELHDRVVGYARGPLVRRLGASGPPAAVRPATQGTRSVVHVVEFASFPPVVLRAVRRWLPGARLAYNYRAFSNLGLPVPSLLDSDLSPLTRWRWGFYALTEQWVPGRHPREVDERDEAVRAVAGALAHFHSVQRGRWGWPAVPRLGSYRRHVLKRVVKRIGHADAALEPSRFAELEAWFRQHAATAALDPPFSLTHSRVNNGNFLVTPDGEAVALDLVECRYGSFCPDLVSAIERLCGRDERLTALFLDEYFAARPPWCRAAFEGSWTFFAASWELAQASVNARRLRRAADEGEPAGNYHVLLVTHVERLAALSGLELTVREP